MKLLCVGWDGATYSHLKKINPPFYRTLKYKGKLLPEDLFCGTHIDSGNAWTTITTGVPFSKHKVLSFRHAIISNNNARLFSILKKLAGIRFLGCTLRRLLLSYGIGKFCTQKALPMSWDIQYKRVWEYLDCRSLIFGLPVTYPAFQTNGILVSGIPAPLFEDADYPTVYPQKIEAEVRKKFKGYYFTQGESPLESKKRKNLDEYLENVFKIHNIGIETFKMLYQREDFGFAYILLPLIDVYLHAINSWDKIENAYKILDQTTADLVEYIRPDNILILSDHGMRSTIRFDKGIKMDHDTCQGIWASNHDFDLKKQVDVTPSILEMYNKNFFIQKRNISQEKESLGSLEEDKIKARLKNLGYL